MSIEIIEIIHGSYGCSTATCVIHEVEPVRLDGRVIFDALPIQACEHQIYLGAFTSGSDD